MLLMQLPVFVKNQPTQAQISTFNQTQFDTCMIITKYQMSNVLTCRVTESENV